MAASIRNCSRMVRRLAPMALRTPISRVRSTTETNMMFMMPMPPTNSARLVTNRPMMAMTASLRMKPRDNLVLLVDGEIVGLVRTQMADAAHHLAQFLLRLIKPGNVAGLHLDGHVGPAPDVPQKRPEWNHDAVVKAVAEHHALFLQDADDLKGWSAMRMRFPRGDSPRKRFVATSLPMMQIGWLPSESAAVRKRPSAISTALVCK